VTDLRIKEGVELLVPGDKAGSWMRGTVTGVLGARQIQVTVGNRPSEMFTTSQIRLIPPPDTGPAPTAGPAAVQAPAPVYEGPPAPPRKRRKWGERMKTVERKPRRTTTIIGDRSNLLKKVAVKKPKKGSNDRKSGKVVSYWQATQPYGPPAPEGWDRRR